MLFSVVVFYVCSSGFYVCNVCMFIQEELFLAFITVREYDLHDYMWLANVRVFWWPSV